MLHVEKYHVFALTYVARGKNRHKLDHIFLMTEVNPTFIPYQKPS